MKKGIVLSLSIVITASSLLMTACGDNKNDTVVSAMNNNVSTEIESIAESSIEVESTTETETETQDEIESSTMESQDEIESTMETQDDTEISSVVGEEKEKIESTQTDESKISNGDVESSAFTITDMDATMYATQQCNIRIQPSTQNEIIGSLLQTQEIHVTGKVNEVNWYRISLSDGTEGYISAGVLSSTKPAVQIETPSTAQATTQQPSETPAQSQQNNDNSQFTESFINPATGEEFKPGDVLSDGKTIYAGDFNGDDFWSWDGN